MSSKKARKYLSVFRTNNKSEEESGETELYCWGNVPKSNIPLSRLSKADGSKDTFSTKFSLTDKEKSIISMASSENHTIVVTKDFEIFGGGDNTSGQLLPSKKSANLPMSPFQRLPGLNNNNLKVVSVSCGKDFTAFLSNIGRVYTFGGNSFGQLGHSEDRRQKFVHPRMVQGVFHDVLVQVSCGDFSTYVLTKQGKVFACGCGRNGRLGLSNVNSFIKNNVLKLPKYISELVQHKNISVTESSLQKNVSCMTEVKGPLKGTPITSISAGSAHCLAVSVTGRVYGWGSNQSFQLGLEQPQSFGFNQDVDSDLEDDEDGFSNDGVPLPVFLGIQNIANVSAGNRHSMFINNQGRVFGVGDNKSCQLGPQLKKDFVKKITKINWKNFTKEKVTVAKISCGSNHSVLLLDSGNLIAFGDQGKPSIGVCTKVENGVHLINSMGAFDVKCSGEMSYILTSSQHESLLKQVTMQSNILRDLHPIGLNSSYMMKHLTDKKILFNGVRRAFFDLQTVNASFLREDLLSKKRTKAKASDIEGDELESSLVDVKSMVAITQAFSNAALSDKEKSKMRHVITNLVAQLELSISTITEPDQLRAFFILLVSPLPRMICPAEHEMLMTLIFKLPLLSRRRLFSWFYTDIACEDIELLQGSLIKPALTYLDSHIIRRKYTKQVVYLCKYVHCLYSICMKMNEMSDLQSADELLLNKSLHIPSSLFYTDGFDQIPDGALAEIYTRWEQVVTNGSEELNGRVRTAGGPGLMPFLNLRMFGQSPFMLQNRMDNPEEEAESDAESVKPKESVADVKIEGSTFGLQKFGLELLTTVDNSFEDTLDNLSPDLVFFKHPFLLSAATKRKFMRIHDTNMHHENMLAFVRDQVKPQMVLEVRRGSDMIQDVFAVLRGYLRQRSSMLRRPLKVKFSGEEGEDAGGIRKEMFLLLSQDLFSQKFGFFEEINSSHLVWFANDVDPFVGLDNKKKNRLTYAEYLKVAKESAENEGRNADIQIVGTIIGLAVYNDTLLDVQFPPAMYQMLLKSFKPESLDLTKYKQFDPESAKQLEYLTTITDPKELEMLDLTFEVTQSRFDVLMDIELCPNGRKRKVTQENLEEYINTYIKFKMYSPYIEHQAKALTKGFQRVIPSSHSALKLFNPDELELLLCGTRDLNFELLKGSTRYVGYAADHPTVKAFWEVLFEMNYEQRKKFLKFSTGSSRAPIGGLKNINFILQRAGPDSPQLPTSHTCFNTLMLPEYASKDKMQRLMLLAIENSEGFGLQ